MKTKAEISTEIDNAVRKLAMLPTTVRSANQAIEKAYWTGTLNALEWMLEE